MAYDELVASRLRVALPDRSGLTEVRMFGCLCFMLNGHMLAGVGAPGFLFRVGKDNMAAALSRPGATPMMDAAGRRMGGVVWVDPAQCGGRRLSGWISLARAFVTTLPPKEPRQPVTRRRKPDSRRR